MAKRGLCLLLALVTTFSLCVPALAEEEVAVTDEPVATEEPVVTEEPIVTEVPEETAEPETAAGTAANGTCGANVAWSFADGTLTVSGNGAMTDYASAASAPWYDLRDSIKKVVIQQGVTSVGSQAFHSYKSLTSVTIPEGVTRIGAHAFRACSGLFSVTIPGSVVTVGAWAFAQCGGLEQVTIQDGVQEIYGYAFNNCTKLSTVSGPQTLTQVGRDVFTGTPWEKNNVGPCVILGNCLVKIKNGLTSLTTPPGPTIIADYACWANETLQTLTISEGVRSIGNQAFWGAWQLRSVKLPASLQYIGPGAFGSIDTLASVEGLASDAVLKGDPFDGSPWYTKQKTAEFVVVGGTLQKYNGDGKTAVTVPDGVVAIGYMAFLNHPEITAVTLPASVKVIDIWAFFNCTGLTSMEIPAGVQTIFDSAFSGCTGLKTIKVLNSQCDIQDPQSNPPGLTLGVPGTTQVIAASGSTAEAYAKKHGYAFQSLGEAPKPTATPKPQLAAPTVKIEKVSTGIKVSWNKIAGAPRYMVYYKENSGGWKKIGTTTATTYTRAAKYLKNNVTYTFTVRCCENDKKTLLGPYKVSNSLKYTAQLAAPTVKIAKVANGIKVSWNKIAGSPRYMVYYKAGNGGWTRIGTTTATSYTRKAAQLKNGVTYQFTVRCCENDKKTLLGPYKASNSLKYTK